MEVAGKKVVIIFIPVPQLKSFQKIQVTKSYGIFTKTVVYDENVVAPV